VDILIPIPFLLTGLNTISSVNIFGNFGRRPPSLRKGIPSFTIILSEDNQEAIKEIPCIDDQVLKQRTFD
jgi:hypothetical protein